MYNFDIISYLMCTKMVLPLKVTSEGSRTLSQPSSQLIQSILHGNRLSRLIHLLVVISLIVKGCLGLYTNYWINNSNHSKEGKGKFDKEWNKLYALTLGLTIAHFLANSSVFKRFWAQCSTIVHNYPGFEAAGYLRKWSQINLASLTLATIYETATLILENYYTFKLNLRDLNFWYCFNLIIAQAGWILYFQLLIETVIYLQLIFVILDCRLSNLQLNDNDNDDCRSLEGHKPFTDYYQLIRSIRGCYIKTVGCSRTLDSYLSLGVATFYVHFVGYCLFIFSNIFDFNRQTVYPLIVTFERFIGESMYLIYLTYHLVKVHKLSVQIYDKVYDLTLAANISTSTNVINEVNLFLQRINREDVGFTFANLIVITPSFVSSLATISLTLGLALPSLLGR